MNGIKFNQTTGEIEIKGSESFIESHFDMIEDLLTGSLGVIAAKGSTKSESEEESILWVDAVEPQAAEAMKIPGVSKTPGIALAPRQNILRASQEPGVKRPPVRKYFDAFGKLIKSEDTSINRNPTVSLSERKPTEISIASLREKFGLPESKIGSIMRDAEKHGKIERAENGSYVWSQD